ncbi:hypothetical protein CEXT_275871 [Caerostris extrusa]|uniref:Uncharacterized protein n=1 Tax=Caerostris extrusa TaxID=172846 RepID=A0AAV4QUN5_CAEEX|nr:hypothetical protein CEXT_275871 [Caerostris extrusa]
MAEKLYFPVNVGLSKGLLKIPQGGTHAFRNIDIIGVAYFQAWLHAIKIKPILRKLLIETSKQMLVLGFPCFSYKNTFAKRTKNFFIHHDIEKQDLSVQSSRGSNM